MKTAGTFVQNNLAALRRATQISSILAGTVFLLSGQIGLDLETSSILFFDSRVWPHEMALILLGLATPFVFLAGLSLALGRVFCGWLCPQTALCELATWIQSRIASARAKGRPYLLAMVGGVAVLALLLSLSAGLVLVSVFVSPQSLLRMLNGELSTSLLKAITIASFLVLVDIVLLRHTFCEWLCVVGWWQRLFARRGGLRVAFATDRARECQRCSECKAACFMRIDPRRRELPGTCLNCGKCVSACKLVMAQASAGPLIQYQLGDHRAGSSRRGTSRVLGAARVGGFALLVIVVTGLLSWTVSSRAPVQIKVRQAQRFAVELVDGMAKGAYVVDIYNTGTSDLSLELSEDGLPRESVIITPNPVRATSGGSVRARLSFHVNPSDLHPGRNVFVVNAQDLAGGSTAVSDRVVFGLPVTPPASAALPPTAEGSGGSPGAYLE